jgi:outer membrane lipoprotein SlyB
MPSTMPIPRRPARAVALLTLTLLVSACAANRPVLYPDSRGAEQDVEDCMRLAKRSGADAGKAADVARDTAVGAAMGGAATGVYGAVRGYGDAGERAAAGAAAGASVGLIRGMVQAGQPPPAYKRYVERCLRERGHDVIGWN